MKNYTHVNSIHNKNALNRTAITITLPTYLHSVLELRHSDHYICVYKKAAHFMCLHCISKCFLLFDYHERLLIRHGLVFVFRLLRAHDLLRHYSQGIAIIRQYDYGPFL